MPRKLTKAEFATELMRGNDPMEALQGASTIGASRVGERYVPTDNPSLLDMIRKFIGGEARPASVAMADPTGMQAYMKGAGSMPGLMMPGETGIVGEGVAKLGKAATDIAERRLNPAGMLPKNIPNERRMGELMKRFGGGSPMLPAGQSMVPELPKPAPVQDEGIIQAIISYLRQGRQ